MPAATYTVAGPTSDAAESSGVGFSSERRYARAVAGIGYFTISRRHGRACPGHPRLSCRIAKTWMPGTSPGMTGVMCLALQHLVPPFLERDVVLGHVVVVEVDQL